MSSEIADLLAELDIESWLDHEGIKHKRTRGTSGLQLNVRECPCCGNSNWKVYLNAETGLGNCFVCDEKFTKWTFIKASLGLDGRATFGAVESFVKSQGWTSKPTQARHEKAELVLPDSVELPCNGKNLKYLSERGITAEVAQAFGLRYSKDGVFRYKNEYGRDCIQSYARRIIIPVRDENGELVSFQGRDTTGAADKKYLFPPEYASTGSILYNLHAVKSKPVLAIGEGAFDAIATAMGMGSGPVGAVASFGKRLGEGQLRKLKALRDAGTLRLVVFIWDAEEKAIEAAVEAALACRSHGIPAKVALLPPYCDPNEVDASVVRASIRDAKDVEPLSGIKLKMLAKRYAPARS